MTNQKGFIEPRAFLLMCIVSGLCWWAIIAGVGMAVEGMA